MIRNLIWLVLFFSTTIELNGQKIYTVSYIPASLGIRSDNFNLKLSNCKNEEDLIRFLRKEIIAEPGKEIRIKIKETSDGKTRIIPFIQKGENKSLKIDDKILATKSENQNNIFLLHNINNIFIDSLTIFDSLIYNYNLEVSLKMNISLPNNNELEIQINNGKNYFNDNQELYNEYEWNTCKIINLNNNQVVHKFNFKFSNNKLEEVIKGIIKEMKEENLSEKEILDNIKTLLYLKSIKFNEYNLKHNYFNIK